MESLSQVARQPRPEGATRGRIHRGERLRRVERGDASSRRAQPRALAGWIAQLRHAFERTLRLGANTAQPLDIHKRLRLCNVNAVGGGVIMTIWLVIELVFGEIRNIPVELVFV